MDDPKWKSSPPARPIVAMARTCLVRFLALPAQLSLPDLRWLACLARMPTP